MMDFIRKAPVWLFEILAAFLAIRFLLDIAMAELLKR
jgi:hypothetical protein